MTGLGIEDDLKSGYGMAAVSRRRRPQRVLDLKILNFLRVLHEGRERNTRDLNRDEDQTRTTPNKKAERPRQRERGLEELKVT